MAAIGAAADVDHFVQCRSITIKFLLQFLLRSPRSLVCQVLVSISFQKIISEHFEEGRIRCATFCLMNRLYRVPLGMLVLQQCFVFKNALNTTDSCCQFYFRKIFCAVRCHDSWRSRIALFFASSHENSPYLIHLFDTAMIRIVIPFIIQVKHNQHARCQAHR